MMTVILFAIAAVLLGINMFKGNTWKRLWIPPVLFIVATVCLFAGAMMTVFDGIFRR